HHVLLPEEGRGTEGCGVVLPGNRRALHEPWTRDDIAGRRGQRVAAWVESLGERFHHAVIHYFRPQSAGRIRNHDPVVRPHQAERLVWKRRLPRNPPDGVDILARLFRLRRAICGDAAGGVGHERRRASAGRNDYLRARTLPAVLPAGAVPFVFEE